MFEPGWILIGSIEDRLDDSTQFESARLKPNPLFYMTPNFPLFFNQTLNSSPSQTSMAATNTFEPGWILIGFIENHLNDLKLFDTLRLRPIPIFYGTRNFPIFLVRTINSSSSKTSMAATNRFDPCWILIFSIEDRLRDLKQFDPARLKPIPFIMGRQPPYNHCSTKKTSQSQTSMAASNTFEPGWILIGFIENRLGDLTLFDTARLRPIPIFYGTPNFLIFFVQTINSSSPQTFMAATNMFEPGWIPLGFIVDRQGDTKHFNPARLKPIPI